MKPFVLALTGTLLLFLNTSCETTYDAHDQRAVPIEGAFGLKLGAIFDTSGGGLEGSADPILRYTFVPTNTFRSFVKHSVHVTHNEHKICRISAMANFNSRSEAELELDILMKLLSSKYGPEWRFPKEGQPGGLRAIRQKNRSIVAGVQTSSAGGHVIIAYNDESLQKLAEREGIRRLDKSGL